MQILIRTLTFIAIVLVLGLLDGFGAELGPNQPAYSPYVDGIVLFGLLFGAIYFNGLISKFARTGRVKLVLTVVLALVAGCFAYWYFSVFGYGEVMEPISAGWSDDRSTYTEYPILAFHLIAFVISVLYLVVGGALWFFSLVPRSSDD